MKIFKSIPLVLWLLLTLTACSSSYRAYEGAPQSISDLALLNAGGFLEKGAAINKVNGKWRGLGHYKQYELLPGLTKIEFHLAKIGYKGDPITVEFIAEKGTSYDFEVVFDTQEIKERFLLSDIEFGKWYVLVKESGTNKVVNMF